MPKRKSGECDIVTKDDITNFLNGATRNSERFEILVRIIDSKILEGDSELKSELISNQHLLYYVAFKYVFENYVFERSPDIFNITSGMWGLAQAQISENFTKAERIIAYLFSQDISINFDAIIAEHHDPTDDTLDNRFATWVLGELIQAFDSNYIASKDTLTSCCQLRDYYFKALKEAKDREDAERGPKRKRSPWIRDNSSSFFWIKRFPLLRRSARVRCKCGFNKALMYENRSL